MKTSDKYTLYVGLVIFVGSFVPDRGEPFDVSLNAVLLNAFHAVLFVGVIVLVSRLMVFAIAEHLTSRNNNPPNN